MQIQNIGAMFMVFNATFNNISVISWRSVYWWGYPKNTTDLSRVTDKLLRFTDSDYPLNSSYHKMLFGVHIAMRGTDCTDSCNNFHTITGRRQSLDDRIH